MAKKRGERLTSPEVAKRLGISGSTWRGYLHRAELERAEGRDRPGLAPPADGWYDARTRWWWESTIDEFQRGRRGQGWRARESEPPSQD